MDYKNLSKIIDSSRTRVADSKCGVSITLDLEQLLELGEDVAWQVIQLNPFSAYTEEQLQTIYDLFNPDLSYREWIEINKD